MIGIFMNTDIGLIRQRRWKRPEIGMVVINKMLKELEVPQNNEGFDELKEV